MSIKYNKFGEVISVNGLTTGQHLGKPMQDAKPKKAEHNEAYAIAKKTIGNSKNSVDDNQPENIGDELEERIEALEGGSPDWNASEGEVGHIKNRTHYERTIVHDFVTEIIVPSGTSLADGYGTLPNLKIPIRNVVMPEGKYILIRLGGEELKLTALPPNAGGSRPAYREDITLNNGVTIRIMLTTNAPGTHLGDRNNYYYNVMPLPDGAEVPYIGQTYSVSLCEDELKQLDPKFLPEGIGGDSCVRVYYDADSGQYVCNKSYDEICALIDSKFPLLGVYKDSDIRFMNQVGDYRTASVPRIMLQFVNIMNTEAFTWVYLTPDGNITDIEPGGK